MANVNEKIHGVPARIADLKRKLEAREGNTAMRENVPAIRAEITRLEAISQRTESLQEFIATGAVASKSVEG